MTTQAQTLRQRLEVLAQWEEACSESAVFHSPFGKCARCNDTGKVPVLPGLRKPCPCTTIIYGDGIASWYRLGGCVACWKRGVMGFSKIHDDECHCMLTATPGWVLRGNPDTRDGQMLLFWALQQALLKDGWEIEWLPGPPIRVQIRKHQYRDGDLYACADGDAALVDAVMQLKEAQA